MGWCSLHIKASSLYKWVNCLRTRIPDNPDGDIAGLRERRQEAKPDGSRAELCITASHRRRNNNNYCGDCGDHLSCRCQEHARLARCRAYVSSGCYDAPTVENPLYHTLCLIASRRTHNCDNPSGDRGDHSSCHRHEVGPSHLCLIQLPLWIGSPASCQPRHSLVAAFEEPDGVT